VTGQEVRKEEINLVARVMAMGKMHKTFAITAGIPAAIAAVIPGSTVHQVTGGASDNPLTKTLNIGHPSGQMDVRVEVKKEGEHLRVVSCTVGRTARKIMEGWVFVPANVYSSRRQPRIAARGDGIV
jgi:hypothetical protein